MLWFGFRQREDGKMGRIFSHRDSLLFDKEQDKASDHVESVEICASITIHTIERNSGDVVRTNCYTVYSKLILRYGMITY